MERGVGKTHYVAFQLTTPEMRRKALWELWRKDITGGRKRKVEAESIGK